MGSILANKQTGYRIHIPAPSEERIPRPVLLKKLDDALHGKLILVSAQAGFGKTTVVSDWVLQRKMGAVWFSLNEADNDPVRFLRNWLSYLSPTQTSDRDNRLSVESMLSLIVHKMSDDSETLLFVLDNYQVIQTSAVHQAIEYLLKYSPVHAHFTLISREDPPLRLSTLRLSGEVSRISSHDLRFTRQETTDLLKHTYGIELPEDDAEQLHRYTDGWVGEIRLIASLSNGRHISRFVQSSGNKNRSDDGLSKEIFQTQDVQAQRFLLETSILERLNPSLCHAVTGDESTEMLERLERANLITLIWREGRWFHYHPLFADYLYARSEIEFGSLMADLHSKASRWFEENGYFNEAINHALKGQDFKTAERLIDQYAPDLLRRGEQITLQRWLSRIPKNRIENHWRLAVVHGWLLAIAGHYDESVQTLNQTKDADRSFHAEKSIIEAYIAICQKKPGLALRLFQRATQESPEISRYLQEGIDLNLGEVQVIRGLLGMGGSLNKVNELYPQLRLLWKHSELGILGYGSVIMAELMYERNQPDQAMYFVTRGIELGRRHENIGVLVSVYMVYIGLKQAEGNKQEFDSMIETLRKEVAHSDAAFRWMPILRALEMRLILNQKDPDVAVVDDWIDHCGIHVDEPPELTREFETLTFVRAQIYRKRYAHVQHFLRAWLNEATRTDRLATQIEILILQASAMQKRGNSQKALDCLHQALMIAEPEGYIRIFLDEARPLAELLFSALNKSQSLKESSKMTAYVKKLLDLFAKELGTLFWSHSNQSLVEPLTQREMEILQCMSEGLGNSVTAKRLGIKIGTVKGYVVNINGKLDAQSRTQAVAKAWKLGLIKK